MTGFRPTPPPAKRLRLEDEGEDLCNCVFTLGSGSLPLLHNAQLRLKRGKNYGVLGDSGCGKRSLMCAINNGQVNGFPPKSELTTALLYGSFGFLSPECHWKVHDYLLHEPVIRTMYDAGDLSSEQMVHELEKVGFTQASASVALAFLSEISIIRMGLVRAKLMQADILLLLEPTKHLRKADAEWLIDYINSLKTAPKPVTVLATSHDPHYLESTTTHILEFADRKLIAYEGTLMTYFERHKA